VGDALHELARKDRVHVIGYPVTKTLYDNFQTIGKEPSRIRLSIPACIISVSLMESSPFYLKQFSSHQLDNNTPIELHHVVAEQFWDRYWQWECALAESVTIDWLKSL
jgi:hypothetical protein